MKKVPRWWLATEFSIALSFFINEASATLEIKQYYDLHLKLSITFLFSAASIIWLLVDIKIGYIIYGILMFLLIIFVLKTDIVFEHKSGGKNASK